MFTYSFCLFVCYREILEKGGYAVDAAIATLLCIGTMNPNNINIGGGHFMMYYDARNKKMSMYDAREVAPSAATQDMFVNDTTGKSTRGNSSSGCKYYNFDTHLTN